MFMKLCGKKSYPKTTIQTQPYHFNRLFSNKPILIPHTDQHIILQKKLFKHENIPAKIITLPTGTNLIGLNITSVEPHFLGTSPVYNPDILDLLSPCEKEEWQEMSKTYYAQVAKYELLCDVNCVTSSSVNGVSIYYIDPGLLDVKSYTPIHKMINFDEPVQNTLE